MKHSAIFNAFDIVIIPFPYADNSEHSKRRPAVVLSNEAVFNAPTGQLICAMITSGKSPWPHDCSIANLKSAGLDKPCVIRMKLFTLDRRFVLRKAGALHKSDRAKLQKSLKAVLF